VTALWRGIDWCHLQPRCERRVTCLHMKQTAKEQTRHGSGFVVFMLE